ncbi:MAG: hypothetical protein P8R05_09145 [Alphaproteobacteria bacterium]|nr:hypothetical protein [Alphaproteobacteria bacterium]
MNSTKKTIYLILFACVLCPSNLIANDIYLPSAGFDCRDDNIKLEFLFDRSKDMDNPRVYRRVDGKFIFIGNLLAEKQGAYVLWEDKDYFKTTDFAWTMDKVTSKLSSIVLSVGLGIDNLKKIPKPMTCMQKIFYY